MYCHHTSDVANRLFCKLHVKKRSICWEMICVQSFHQLLKSLVLKKYIIQLLLNVRMCCYTYQILMVRTKRSLTMDSFGPFCILFTMMMLLTSSKKQKSTKGIVDIIWTNKSNLLLMRPLWMSSLNMTLCQVRKANVLVTYFLRRSLKEQNA